MPVQELWSGPERLVRETVLMCMERRGLSKDPAFANIVMQIWHALQVCMGVAVLGPPGCGKSMVIALCQVHSGAACIFVILLC